MHQISKSLNLLNYFCWPKKRKFNKINGLPFKSDRLLEVLDRPFCGKQRILISGRAQGGGSFGRGALYHLLQNRIYRGEAVHKGVAYPGEHKAIVDEELWRAVQDRLAANRTIRRKSRIETGALLGGLIYDDRGNIMSPTYSIRRGYRYRYYISSALLHDRRSCSQDFTVRLSSSLSDLNANPLISLKLRILALTKILSNINHLLI